MTTLTAVKTRQAKLAAFAPLTVAHTVPANCVAGLRSREQFEPRELWAFAGLTKGAEDMMFMLDPVHGGAVWLGAANGKHFVRGSSPVLDGKYRWSMADLRSAQRAGMVQLDGRAVVLTERGENFMALVDGMPSRR